MAVLAHPDDESLGVGGVLALYAREGVGTWVVTATRGERGRHGRGDEPHPGLEALGRRREAELRAAAEVLGVREVRMLEYVDRELDEADPREAVGRIVAEIRRVRPQVLVTFDPQGAYGHPDHIAICQLTTAAVSCAPDPAFRPELGEPHRVLKLYYIAWSAAVWEVYQSAFKRLTTTVDGVERQVAAWPEWAITTRVDAREHWRTVWRAVRRHETQMAIYGALEELSPEQHEILWGTQTFYRASSTVNGGRRTETDLFEGIA